MKNGSWQLIEVDQSNAWMSVLNRCDVWDTYALPEYHRVAQKTEGGVAYLFVFEKDGETAALPFLLRQIDCLEGICLTDATSVYGYPGILCSKGANCAEAGVFRNAFQKALLSALGSLKCVSFILRLNPLIFSEWILSQVFDVKTCAQTVAIDLSSNSALQIRGMSKGHRYDIRKARNNGVEAYWDREYRHLDQFVAMYHETMDRTGATPYYYFSEHYYVTLRNLLGRFMRLYVATVKGIVVAASLFLFSKTIVQYHLSGSPTDALRWSGAKVILDQVRMEAASEGFRWLHLGGGVGSQDDSLFQFKAGFSKNRFPFKIARLVVNKEKYQKLCMDYKTLSKHHKKTINSTNYFPAYRTPVIKN